MFECASARPGGEQADTHCPPLLVEPWGGALHAPARAQRKLREPPGRERGLQREAPLVSRVLHGDPPKGWRTEECELNPGTGCYTVAVWAPVRTHVLHGPTWKWSVAGRLRSPGVRTQSREEPSHTQLAPCGCRVAGL